MIIGTTVQLTVVAVVFGIKAVIDVLEFVAGSVEELVVVPLRLGARIVSDGLTER